MIDFEINQQSRKKISKAIWKKWLDDINNKLKIKKKLEISIAIVSEREIRKLNKIYRKKDKVTDVLSFGEIDLKGFDFAKEKNAYIGEIVICFNQAERQAKKIGHSVNEEIKILLVHGFLHLLGHDHEKSNGEADLMKKIEGLILGEH